MKLRRQKMTHFSLLSEECMSKALFENVFHVYMTNNSTDNSAL